MLKVLMNKSEQKIKCNSLRERADNEAKHLISNGSFWTSVFPLLPNELLSSRGSQHPSNVRTWKRLFTNVYHSLGLKFLSRTPRNAQKSIAPGPYSHIPSPLRSNVTQPVTYGKPHVQSSFTQSMDSEEKNTVRAFHSYRTEGHRVHQALSTA